jgi:predicted Zn-dependent protease
VVAAGLAAWLPDSVAIDVWTPETGEVRLEELPRETVEMRRQHALALIGAGQWDGAITELRLLIEAEPEAEWVPEARFAIARGLLAAGRPSQAFDELEAFLASHPDTPFAARVRPLQLNAAQLEATRDVDSAAELYETWPSSASSRPVSGCPTRGTRWRSASGRCLRG